MVNRVIGSSGIRCAEIVKSGKRKGSKCGKPCASGSADERCVNHRPVTCSECDRKFSSKYTLKTHIITVHKRLGTCKCVKCGHTFSTKGNMSNHTKRCTGKVKCSSGEYQVMLALKKLLVSYCYNLSFILRNSDGNGLRWDFKIESSGCSNLMILFIEYNGRQHYEPVEFFGGKKQFVRQQLHDKLKDDFCRERGYPILWIGYKDFDNIEKLVTDFVNEYISFL